MKRVSRMIFLKPKGITIWKEGIRHSETWCREMLRAAPPKKDAMQAMASDLPGRPYTWISQMLFSVLVMWFVIRKE